MKDAAIILSHRFRPDRNFSEEYKKRLDKGIELVLRREAKHIILCSEAATESVKEYVVGKGVQSDKILLQTKSRDSIGEAFLTKKDILIPRNWRDIFVVSSDYHIRYRIGLVFDFIFGRNFDIKYVGVESGRLNDSETVKDQISSLYAFINLFEGIEPENDEAIEKRLLERHKLYKKVKKEKIR